MAAKTKPKPKVNRRGERGAHATQGPGVQIRTTYSSAAIIDAIAKREKRTLKDQSEILVIAGAKALGYDLSKIDLNQ